MGCLVLAYHYKISKTKEREILEHFLVTRIFRRSVPIFSSALLGSVIEAETLAETQKIAEAALN